MAFTSYEIQWRRVNSKPRPDFVTTSDSATYVDEDGRELFTVTTAEGVPSEGIFVLINEAPRIRDELDGLVR